MSRSRRPTRVGDILPGTAAGLGLTDELRLARLMAVFDSLVSEHVPAAAGGCRIVGVERRMLVVEADHPAIGQELRLHEPELLAGMRRAATGSDVDRLRVRIGRRGGGAPL
jgi:hypothetical protein